MAKVYGVTFLGAPRTREAENACCAPLLMGVSVVALALCCIAGGVAAPWLLPLLGHAIPLPLVTAHTVVSQPMMALLLIAAPLLPFVLMLFFRRDRLASRSRGVGLRLRTRAVDGHHRPRFRHAGEGELCRRAEAAPLAEPGGLGAGLAGCRRARTVPPPRR